MKQWTVRDVMNTDVVTVELDTPYVEIVDILARHQVNGVPVLDELHRLVGVVSEGDLLRRVEFMDGDESWHLFDGRRAESPGARAAASSRGI
jgi:CBS domain-containing protein